MDINVLAKQYAEGKALEAISTAIEQAYINGYNDGMQHREKLILESIVDGVEYVDLDLPSQKMWSSSYIKDKDSRMFLPYIEASKLNIPTRKDFEELLTYCKVDYYLTKNINGIKFTGRNGGEIIIPYNRIKDDDFSKNREYFSFWIKDDEDSPTKSFAYSFSRDSTLTGAIRKTFMGYKLPIMLVKEGSKI